MGEEIIPVEVDETKVWNVTVSPVVLTIKEIGDTYPLTVTVNPITAVDQTFTCTSSNEEVLTVDNEGVVTAVGNGTATVTVTTTDGGKIAKSTVTVGSVEASEVTVARDFIAFEADATNSPLGDNWVVVREGDSDYGEIGGDLAPINGTYIKATQGATNGLGVSAGTDMLQYKFTPICDGDYFLTGRMAQQMVHNGVTAPWDECNDIYIKMEGDFDTGDAETPLNILQNWNKYYGRGKQLWGAFVQIDVSHAKYKASYKLKAGQEYTFSISARSKGVCIDYFLLTRTVVTAAESMDLATVNDDRLRPGGDTTFVDDTYKAIEFEKFTGMGGDFVDAKIDAAKQALQIDVPLAWAAAETTYNGQDANVFISLETLLEIDGESTFKVFVNDDLIQEVTNTRIYGTSASDYTPFTHILGTSKHAMKNGDKIRVEFCSATNGLVPEGNSTATSRGRWRNLHFYTSEMPQTDYSGVAAPELISNNAPTVVPVNFINQNIEIVYTTGKPVDFEITIHDITSWITEGFTNTHITDLATGIDVKKTFAIAPVAKPISEGVQYRWVMYFTNVGGTWKDGYDQTIVKFTASSNLGTHEIESCITAPTVFGDLYHMTADKVVRNIQFVHISGSVLLDVTVNSQEANIATSSLQEGIYIAVIHFEDGKTTTAKVLKK